MSGEAWDKVTSLQESGITRERDIWTELLIAYKEDAGVSLEDLLEVIEQVSVGFEDIHDNPEG